MPIPSNSSNIDIIYEINSIWNTFFLPDIHLIKSPLLKYNSSTSLDHITIYILIIILPSIIHYITDIMHSPLLTLLVPDSITIVYIITFIKVSTLFSDVGTTPTNQL